MTMRMRLFHCVYHSVTKYSSMNRYVRNTRITSLDGRAVHWSPLMYNTKSFYAISRRDTESEHIRKDRSMAKACNLTAAAVRDNP